MLDNMGARHRYALALIAITTTLSFFMFWVALKTHDQGQDQLILLANQMARAERMALDTYQLVTLPEGAERENTRRFMETTAATMAQAHGDYVNQLENPFRFGTNSPAIIDPILHGPGDNLDKVMRRFLALAETLARAPAATLTTDDPQVISMFTEAREVLVPRLEALHDIHLDHLRETTTLANWIAFFMWLALMALLLVEARLIFHPLSRQVTSQVNDLRAAYDNLENEKRKFEGTLAGLPDAVVVVDESGTITKVNLATEALLGHGEEDLVGQPIEVLVPIDQRDEHRVNRQDLGRGLVRRVMGRRRDITALRKDGTRLPVEINLNSVRLDGETVIIATIIDLSDRIALEGDRLAGLRGAIEAFTQAARSGSTADLDASEARIKDLLDRLTAR